MSAETTLQNVNRDVSEEIALRVMEFTEQLENEVKTMKAEKAAKIEEISILNAKIQAWERQIAALNLKTDKLVETPQPKPVEEPKLAEYRPGQGFVPHATVPAVPQEEDEEEEEDATGNNEHSNVSTFPVSRAVNNPDSLTSPGLSGISWRLKGQNHYQWKQAGSMRGLITVGTNEYLTLKKSQGVQTEYCTVCNQDRGDEQPSILKKGEFYLGFFSRHRVDRDKKENFRHTYCLKHVPTRFHFEIRDAKERLITFEHLLKAS